MRQWGAFKACNPAAKLVCIDIQPNATTQANERADVLNVGGFCDEVFDMVSAFADGTLSPGSNPARSNAMGGSAAVEHGFHRIFCRRRAGSNRLLE